MAKTAFRTFALFAVCIFAASTAMAMPQTKDQQKCITKLNKQGSKVAARQGKENAKCVKFAGKGKLDKLGSSTAQECLTKDFKGKVAKDMLKTQDFEDKFCSEVGSIPEFGLPSGTIASTVNNAAQNNELRLVDDIFGQNLDAAIIDCDVSKDGCKCQDKVAKDMEKLMATKLKEFIKCKKFALKDGKSPFLSGAASAADLEDCVDNPLTDGSIAQDSKGKIGKKGDKLAKDIFKKCYDKPDVPVDIATAFPNLCSDKDPSGGETLGANELAQCIDERVECRACLMINEMDNLNVDCDTFDDGNANGSCPPPEGTSHKCTLAGSTCDSGFCTLKGNPCTQDKDCTAEGSNLSIITELTPIPPQAISGAIDIDCGDGTLDINGKAACTCEVQSFDPIPLLGIGTVCIEAGNNSCDPGEIDCDGGNDLSWDTAADHNIGACTSNADCASQCDTECGILGGSQLSSGCENFCAGGANDGLACTDDTDCPDGSCNGPDGGAHGNICGCQCLTQVAPPALPGGMACQMPTKIYVVLPAGSPCTNPATIDLPPSCIPLTTASASANILNANNGGGTFGNAGAGVDLSCLDLFSSVTTGAELVGVTNFFDSTLGDLSVLTTAVCQ